MFKQITAGEVKVGERVYLLLADPQSPLSEVQDVLMLMYKQCAEKMEAAQKASEEQKPQENPDDQ